MGDVPPNQVYEFGEFVLEVRQRRLRKRDNSESVPITARAFDALLYLVERRGRLVEKSELMGALWPNVVVEEGNLSTTIYSLRKLLGERPDEHRYIVTVAGRGYRFVADVMERSAVVTAAETVRVESASAQAARTTPEAPRRWVTPLVLTVLALVAVAAVWFLTRSSSGSGAPSAMVVSARAKELSPLSAVAVLPFDNATGDPALDPPGADLVRSLNRVLSEAPNLAVVAHRSADSHAGDRGDVRDIARALGVTHLLETRAVRSGDDIKVSVELIDGRLGYQVWSKDFRTAGNDFIGNRDPMLLAIAAVVGSSGGSTVFEDREPATANVDAYVEWLRGLRSMTKLNDPGFVAALQHFKSATDLDPDFGLAWMTTAAVHSQMMSIGFERPDSAARFREASERARQIQPDSKIAHSAFARVAAAHGEWLAAEEHFQAATGDGAARSTSVMYVYLQVGRLREAEHDLRRLHAESPGDPNVALNLAIVCGIAGKSRESQGLIDQVVQAGIPDNLPVLFILRANIAEQAGRHQEAADQMMMALDPALRAAGGDEAVHLYYEALGRTATRPRAIAALKRLEPLLSHERFSTYSTRALLIYWNARLGAVDQAYHLAHDWVAQYRGSTLVGVPHLAPLWSPDLREFRADPRFAQLATDLGFMDYWKKRGPPDGCRLDGEKLRCS